MLLAIGLGGIAALPGGCKKDESKSLVPALATASSSSAGQGGTGGAGGGAGGMGASGGGSASSAGGAGAGGSVPEDCYDGIDEDGNGLIDCLDRDPACVPICAPDGNGGNSGTSDACAAPKKSIADPTDMLLGDDTEHALLPGVSCETFQDLVGHANVYRFTAASDGVLDATATPSDMANDLVLSARGDCADAKTELVCSDGLGSECVHLAVKKGDTVALIVAGYSGLTYGPFHLSAKTRPSKCGDGQTDPGETCDDANVKAGDGCSDTCQLEVGEVEPNDTVATANAFKDPMIGAISPVGDVDAIAFDVASANTKLVATTKEIPGNDCKKKLTDSAIELVDKDGMTVLASADDTMSVPALLSFKLAAAGKYYLRLKAGSGAPPKHTFRYRWSLKLTP